MKWTIVWKNAARQHVLKMDRSLQIRIFRKVLELGTDPRPPGAKKIRGQSKTWRVRTGDYRILYTIEDDRLVVLVLEVGHRREVYR